MPWVHLDIAGTAYYRKAAAVRAARRDRRLARHARRAGARRRPGRLTGPPAGRPRRPTRPPSRWSRSPAAAVRRVRPRARRRPVRDALAGARRGASARSAGRLADGRRARSSGRWRSGCCRSGSRATRWRSSLFGAWFVTLIVGLATDLDQRLLPDVLTLPVIPVALVYALSGAEPAGRWRARAGRPGRASLIPAVLYLPSHPVRGRGVRDRRRQAARRGRAAGSAASRALGSVIFGLVLAGVVIVVAAAARAGSAGGPTSRSARSSSSARCGRSSSGPDGVVHTGPTRVQDHRARLWITAR